MVFPSRGCITCKTRRIKCDSVHPLCSRCQKAGRDCVWDQNEEAGLLFKDENAFAQGKPRRPWKSKAQEVSGPEAEVVDSAVFPVSSSIPAEDKALQFWLNNYVFRDDEVPEFAREYNHYSIACRDIAQHDSSLRLIISALSHAVFGRVMQLDESIEEAEKLFARSIDTVQRETLRLSQSNIDELLLTTMLMADYKDVTDKCYARPNQDEVSLLNLDVTGSQIWKNTCHYDRATDLMRQRQQNKWTPNLFLDRAVRRRLIRVCILRGISVPEWLRDGVKFGEQGPVLILDSIMVRVAALRERSLCLFLPKSARFSTQPHPGDLAAEARSLDAALESWSAALPEDWKFTTRSGSTPDPTFDVPIHVYATYGHAAIWCRYYATRLIVNSIRNRALSVMAQCSSQMLSVASEQDTCLGNMASLGTDLCRSIPIFFTSVTTEGNPTAARGTATNDDIICVNQEIIPKLATLLAWPLILAINTDNIPEFQKQWLENKLKSVANALGDAILETVTEQNELKF
ncbi:hypothetical protein F4813DRAFT_398086 [Daldinia decipiens]|uniref:uncharacterized protein n=1 Tax=Daldinia decipiens TaxID=326647 RepID=UPI0020C3EA6D|nr:uncharacterized protein F4813DRAFT_398086 [Daldinia decipiens]KAI1655448.1 hypothetical protein F4813DRAFT_398086 [Daldinia decipiens]